MRERVLWGLRLRLLRWALGHDVFVQAPRPLRLRPGLLLVDLLRLGKMFHRLKDLRFARCDVIWEFVRWLAHRPRLGRYHHSGRDVLWWLHIDLNIILRYLPKIIVELLVVRQEDGVVEPEVTLHLHGVDHLLHVLMQVAAH